MAGITFKIFYFVALVFLSALDPKPTLAKLPKSKENGEMSATK